MPEPGAVDAVAIRDAIRAGRSTPVDAVRAAIARARATDGELGWIAHERFDRALDEAAGELPAGPLRGVPVALKDLGGAIAGEPYSAGSRWLRRHDHRAAHDDHVVRRLREAGCVPVARTRTPELGLGITTEPLAFGPTRNPWDRSRSAGGSSGGSAVAVATGVVPIAHGNDSLGSLRIPASACGIVGLKPTRGRVSLGPAIGDEWGGLTVEGLMTRTIGDLALGLDAIAGSFAGDPHAPAPLPVPGLRRGESLRIGLMLRQPDGSPCHPDCVAAARRTAGLLSDAGHVVAETTPPGLERELLPAVMCLVEAGIAFDVERLAAAIGPPRDGDLEEATVELVARGARRRAIDVQRALATFNDYARAVAPWWRGEGDVLLTPTLPAPPPPLGELRRPFASALTASPFTPPANVVGLPAISLPVHRSAEGLPIGVQLVAGFGREDRLMALAALLEERVGWAALRPDAAVR